MKNQASCILYSRDEALAGRLVRIAARIAAVHPVADQEELEGRLEQFGDTILLADLRAPNCLEVLSALRDRRPESVIIALGAPRSDPMLAAEWLVYDPQTAKSVNRRIVRLARPLPGGRPR